MLTINKIKSWEFKNSWVVTLFAVIPFFNFIPFIYMNSRVKNKKNAVFGVVIIILTLVLMLGNFISTNVTSPYELPSYYDVVDKPESVDFMTDEQKKLYYTNSSYASSEEFKQTDEYIAFAEAYEEWYKAEKAWKNTPEIKAEITQYENWNNSMDAISASCTSGLFIVWLFALIMAFIQRTPYLKALKQMENADYITSRISNNTFDTSRADKSQKKEEKTEQKVKPAEDRQTNQNEASEEKLDINKATEEQLSALRGLNIIDAKKAVAYRQEHNGFNSTDEFFNCINAKPHIIVAVQDLIFVGKSDETEKKDSNSSNSGKRRLDL